MKLFIATLLANLALYNCALIEETVAAEYLRNLNSELIERKNSEHEVYWTFYTNLTDTNEQKKNEAAADMANFMKEVAHNISKFNWESYKSEDLKRQLKKLSKMGYNALPEMEHAEYVQALSSMGSNIAKINFCKYEDRLKCGIHFVPEVLQITTKSRNPDEMKYYWREFFDMAGAPSRKSFKKYITLSDKAAKLNGFKSIAEMWLDEYEDPTIESQVEYILETIKPLYRQLHGYVRHRLRQYYGKDVVSETGPIPMHLLGSLFADQWSSIADIVLPFPKKPHFDIGDEMVKQNYTAIKMFQMGDNFFKSMGFNKLPQMFWDKSILEKPTDGRNLDCLASSWDFYFLNDVRIKQCAYVSQNEFIIAHHELGHIQYYLQYQKQPFVYRTGANPGFHEAIGDVVSLSVSTPKHLQRIGLLNNYMNDDETRINNLMSIALRKVALLPYAFTVDKYRWSLFRGEIDESEWNCAFWKMREKYSGIEPPVVRTEKNFDPPGVYHISNGVEYLRYFVSYIIQFQFYKSACLKAGQYMPNNPQMPLDNCDIYGSVSAGEAFAKMLSMGASKPWPDVMEAFTGERVMTAEALMDYFKPLHIWLEAENKRNNITIGWTTSDKCTADLNASH